MPLYFYLYPLFTIYIYILNLVRDGYGFGYVEALRQIPRFFFFIGVLQFLMKKPQLKDFLVKAIILFSCYKVVNHLILILIPNVSSTNIYNMELAGPFGIFGNISSRVFIPFSDITIYRLTGFFNEPSNASAFLFSSFFLAKSIQEKNQNNLLWKNSAKICMIGGFLAFSNAGYLSIATGLIFASLLNNNISYKRPSSFKNFIMIILSVAFIFTALFGRILVAKFEIDNPVIHLIVGFNLNQLSNLDYDFSSGRLDLMKNTLSYISDNPLGLGFSNTKDNIPAGAPLFWLLMTGIPGVLIILFMQSLLHYTVFKYHITQKSLNYYCSILVLIVQQAIYGQWNNGLYYFLVAVFFDEVFKTKKQTILRHIKKI